MLPSCMQEARKACNDGFVYGAPMFKMARDQWQISKAKGGGPEKSESGRKLAAGGAKAADKDAAALGLTTRAKHLLL